MSCKSILYLSINCYWKNMPIDKFGRHHLRVRESSLKYNCVLTIRGTPSDSTSHIDNIPIGYPYILNSSTLDIYRYSFPLKSGVIEYIDVVPADVSICLFKSKEVLKANEVLGKRLFKGDTLMFLSPTAGQNYLFVSIVLKCSVFCDE